MLWLWLVPTGMVILLLLALLTWLATHGGLNFPWILFYAKGKESGFRMAEIHTLRRAAVEAELENPLSLFSSIRMLDRTIRSLLLRLRSRGHSEDGGSQKFVSEIFQFRKRVEFNLPRYRNGIRSSRDLVAGQRIRVVLPGGSTYHASVVENLRRYMAVSYPVGPVQSPGFTWKGQRVNVYFWRAEDAGYSFESKVLDDFLTKKFPLIYLAHSDGLVRSQKRGSVRVDTDVPCLIHHLPDVSHANESPDLSPGYRARLVDLSEDGCALLVGGKAKVGLVLKAEFDLPDQAVVLCGTIRGITFDEKSNRSVLHLQAVAPSDRMRNAILTYVYDIFEVRKTAQSKKKVPGLF